MKFRLSLLAVLLFTAALVAQSAADLQRIDDMRDWLKAIEPQLTSTGVTNARNIATRLNTLKGQFTSVQPPPVVPTLSSLTLTPSTVVGGATVAGVVTVTSPAPVGGLVVALTSSRPVMAPVPASVTVPAGQSSVGFDIVTPVSVETSERAATITATLSGLSQTASVVIQPTGSTPPPPPPPTEICGNNIDDDGNGLIDEDPPCSTAPPSPPPPGGTHGYFDMLVAHPNKVADFSLRTPEQLLPRSQGGYTFGLSGPQAAFYDAAMDAAKITVGTGSNSLAIGSQLRFPIPRPYTSLFVTWDAWYGDEWKYSVHGIESYKHYQFDSPATKIWTEIRTRFSQAMRVDARYYGWAFGPGTGWDFDVGTGKWSGSADAIGPQTGEFQIATQTWTRYFAFFKLDAATGFWEFSLWMADTNRGPVNLLDKRLIKPNGSSLWETFWFELNTSTNAVKAGRPPLVQYGRNVVMLKGISDPTPLLIRP